MIPTRNQVLGGLAVAWGLILSAAPAIAQTVEFFSHASFIASAGSLTTVGFDALAPGNGALVGNEFAAQGLTIVQRDGYGVNVVQNTVPSSYGPNFVTQANISSSPNAISSTLFVSGANDALTNNLDLVFTNPVTAGGLFIGNLGAGSLVAFLDTTGATIASEVLTNQHVGVIFGTVGVPWDNRVFYGVVTTTPIKRIRITNPISSADGITIDDVQFNSVAPVAHAGSDQTVLEGALVSLDGSDSTGINLTFQWTQLAGEPVTLSDPMSVSPMFTPLLPGGFGSQTLTFQLTVSSGSQSSTDTVDIIVTNVNHAPVADAGDDQNVNEDSAVVLSGIDSYDPDSDPLNYQWVQTGGPAVALTGANTAAPSFTAPILAGGVGSAESLTFDLTVSDGTISQTASVTVLVEQVNHAPVADPGSPQTVHSGTPVALDGGGSGDPDGDAIGFSWLQVGGPIVALANPGTATPSFTAPPVSGSETLTFRLTVGDGDLEGEAEVAVTITNGVPRCDLALPSINLLWPPNHGMRQIAITKVTDPNADGVIVTVTGVTQDEPVNGQGDGDSSPDAVIQGAGVLLRAERGGSGNGRVYLVTFTADDGQGGVCTGAVQVGVPKSMKPGQGPVDDGQLYDSTQP